MTDDHKPDAPRGLLRVLGIVFGLAVVVGGVVGSGIMRSPGSVAKGFTSEPMILLVWVLIGGLAMLSAMPIVEAGSSIPRAGGPYPIAERAFGRTAGFLTGWMGWLQYSASNAFIAVNAGEYAHRLGLLTFIDQKYLAMGLILFVAAITWIGTKVSGASQSLASAIKGGAFFLLVIVLFLSPHAPASVPAFAPLTGPAKISAMIFGLVTIYQAYGGWESAIYFSEEVANPEKNVARATFIGIGLVTLLYVLVNAAALHVLTPAQIAGSKLAVGDAAKVTLGAWSDWVVTGLALFSLAAIVNVQVMAATRITFRMAKDGVLPPALAKVSPSGTPRRSLLALVILSLAFAAIGKFEPILQIYLPWSAGPIIIVCLAAIKLRISEPDLPRPWKMPLFPWVAILAAVLETGLVIIELWSKPLYGLWSVLAIIAPLPIFFVFGARWRRQAAEIAAAP